MDRAKVRGKGLENFLFFFLLVFEDYVKLKFREQRLLKERNMKMKSKN